MLTQIEVQGAKLSTLGRSLQDVTDRTGGTVTEMDMLNKPLATLESCAAGLDEAGDRLEAVRREVTEVEQTASSWSNG